MHDHPNMYVFQKILYGQIERKLFNGKINILDRKSRIDIIDPYKNNLHELYCL